MRFIIENVIMVEKVYVPIHVIEYPLLFLGPFKTFNYDNVWDI